ncbi:DUF695 domain-containing protein [Flavobacteriaceae bacterium F08102]|nr:DUF695 domain-containing protein [Flavobacteriaceae bacterium F08102]
MNLRKCILLSTWILFLFPSIVLQAQSDEQWTTYVKTMDKGPMTILVDLNTQYRKAGYKYLVVVGTNTDKCLANGYPNFDGLEELYTFSDAAATVIEKNTENYLVGVLTYECAGFDAYYVKDTTNLKAQINTLFEELRPKGKNYLLIKKDRTWNYYRTELFPNDKTEDFFKNNDLLNLMVNEGDDLEGKRLIKHFIHFTRERNRAAFIKQMKEINFKIDATSFHQERDYPYELIVSREDLVLPEAIEELTQALIKLSSSMNGFYDGWETEVVVKE